MIVLLILDEHGQVCAFVGERNKTVNFARKKRNAPFKNLN